MDFINKVKLPILYDAFSDSWNDLDRDDKADIVMRYIDEIELELVNNKYRVKLVTLELHSIKNLKNHLIKVILIGKEN